MRELEQRMAALTPAQRQQVGGAYQALIRGVTASSDVIGGHFKPSSMAALGMLGELSNAMLSADGGKRFMTKLRTLAPTIGPYVTTLVSAL